MTEISNLLLNYAEARRVLWNSFFRERAAGSESGGEIQEDFQEIDRVLFSSMVWRSIARPFRSSEVTLGVSSFPDLQVVLRDPISTTVAMVTKGLGGAGAQWLGGFELSRDDSMSLEFVEFFDWDQMGFLTSALCRARIGRLVGREGYVGHDVLIGVEQVKFMLGS